MEKINFRQYRDLGALFNASARFFKQHFKHFFKCILFIAGPFILLTSITGASYQSNMLSMSTLMKGGKDALMNLFSPNYFIFIITALISHLLLIGTVYEYIVLYMEKGPNAFDVGDVGRALRKDLGKIISIFLTIILYVLLSIIFLALIGYGLASASKILVVLIALFAIVGLLLVFPQLGFIFTASYLAGIKERINAFSAIGRTWNLMKGYFWWTWLIMFCAYLTYIVLSFAFTLPQIVLTIITTFTNIKGGNSSSYSNALMIVSSIATFCSTLLYSVFYIIAAFHYFSLAEKKEGTGLLERIDEIGKKENDI